MAVGTMVLPLVVGVDGSQPALEAVDWAVDEAGLHGLPLRIVHASLWERFEGEALADTPGADPSLVTERDIAQSIVARAAERARRRNPTVEISTDVLPADARSALLREAHAATALVTGARGKGPIRELLLGSVSLSLSAQATCPVVVVRGRTQNRATVKGRIVLGVGGPETAPAAVRFAVREATVRGCELEAVRVWRRPIHKAEPHPLLTGTPAHHQEEDAWALLDTALAAVDADKHPHPLVLNRVAAEGSARQILLTRAAAADLLVIGAGRRHGHLGPQLGLVGHALLHHADCPVAAVPHMPRADGE